MKKFSVASLMVLAIISLSSCHKIVGTGPVITENRTTREFSEIDFGVPGDMRFIPSETREIIIEAQRNIADVIETYVTGDQLKIRTRNNTNIKSSEDIRITVKGPFVHSLTLSGSGNLNVPATFNPSHAKVRVSGSGNIVLNKVESENLDVTISGSGNIEVLDGTVNNEDISISGSGYVNLFEVIADNVTTHTSGSGSIKVFANEDLNIRISGSGDVFYRGSPAVNTNISGSGTVIKL